MINYPWHQPLWQQFLNIRQLQRLPHAILMTGPKGLAKTELALAISKYVLCQSPAETEACGRCHSCELFAAQAHPDHLLIEPEEGDKTIKIQQIRALIEKQSLTSNIAAWKTVVLHPAHKMTNNASNSLLKLLEEPPAQTLFILVSSQPQQLPITIRSRCQLWPMQSPSLEQAKSWLQGEQIAISETQLQQLLPLSQGAPLMIKQMLEANYDELCAQVNADFEQLLTGKANPIQMSSLWQEHDLLTVLNILQYSMKNKLISQPESQDSRGLWQIMDCIQQTIKLVSSSNNYNKTLLIEDFMISVMRIGRTGQASSTSLSRVSL
ncbi:DNA polymerase III subunit delta' [Methylophaga sp. OBS3]|uniref:DNA polymerase III subunit delta' n=1 Tax=Methylophaga sp. OBS3 TaxID=2991934 RepID=UPI00224D7F58|nr:DNA polymerase III subunit delta' [Methylophaga sp. OBS3]MCX4189254.1 DNA polymerase III subunit delta' [Methylophaga sp. OBS3]